MTDSSHRSAWKSPVLRRTPTATTLMALILCGGCSLWWGRERPATPEGLGINNREDPSLSSGARLLASVISRNGRRELLLQEQPSGRSLNLGPLLRWTPQDSPSLSRNGRYLALLLRQGERSLPAIWDRATGQLHRLPLPMGLEARRLSLAPDAGTLAIEVDRDGHSELRLFDLRGMLEPDLQGGLRLEGGGPSGARQQ